MKKFLWVLGLVILTMIVLVTGMAISGKRRFNWRRRPVESNTGYESPVTAVGSIGMVKPIETMWIK